MNTHSLLQSVLCDRAIHRIWLDAMRPALLFIPTPRAQRMMQSPRGVRAFKRAVRQGVAKAMREAF